MLQKHKKKLQELQIFRPVFTSAKNLKVTASTPAQKAKVPNTEKINLHDKYEFPDLWTVLNGKMKYLQKNRFDKKEGLMALSAQQVQEILADEFLNPSTPEGKEYHGLYVDQFHSPPDGSLIFCQYRSKNNQRGIERSSVQDIHLPSNSEYKKTHCGVNRVGNFMKDIGKSVKVDLLPGILTNHSGCKTVAQILQDADVPKDAIMEVIGHKKPSRSSILDDSTNTNIADTPVEFSFDDDKKFPIFNNCHFNNVTFKL
ncbi:hypothetical protein RhiirA5_427735 [Rhizophagus irregularis]|uniref:Uncharacterized protein n=2 Tax=Rhizophagus irregularis TaxID=588596 RepID=A0A2N0P1Q1_9GLOM|nr:hypothetical protein GLOIN_2v1777293 [Rhizophagus irregularis DAOM 181602=DAOM 197198]PKC00755.1 hypothetical protein RhiirA5_427735 [Rhizophagus irregularis]PKC64145.1 hypothetical protein RhiirA1_462799 [Rhizophagus irregularis]POG69212.1 hypothetical protein GLOIN_2v1777293 [Rhizophagus irregularis DAOM 181602=DAOM 197198]|eukprot:XP_025176078.1 hypothetical protein GLOIN_2v1777293 [Rhizophagus irregularis DAOM 181602=DAOM 197198]